MGVYAIEFICEGGIGHAYETGRDSVAVPGGEVDQSDMLLGDFDLCERH